MNLHDIPDGRSTFPHFDEAAWGRVRGGNPEFGRYYDYLVQREAVGLRDVELRPTAVRPTFETRRYEVRGRTPRELALHVGQILARLDRNYRDLVRGNIRPDSGIAIVLARWELHLVRRSLTMEGLAGHGFNTVEGTRNSYRGYDLFVQEDPTADPLRAAW